MHLLRRSYRFTTGRLANPDCVPTGGYDSDGK